MLNLILIKKQQPPPAAAEMGVRGFPEEVALVSSITARLTNWRSREVTSTGTIEIKSDADKSVIEGFVGLKPSTSRSKTMESYGVGKSSLGVGSSTVSHGPVASNEPSWSSLHLSGGRGGSKVIDGKP